ADAAPLILAPAPCVMKHTEPYDFAWCETHDTTFPLGGTCRFDGRDPIEVISEEAQEQRGRAVKAEMRLAVLRQQIGKLRDDWRQRAHEHDQRAAEHQGKTVTVV